MSENHPSSQDGSRERSGAASAHRPTAIAFFLPQFHPVAENDAWWGKGFTEWRNVAQAKPLFRGHEQPHLPADLGFYDLRVPEVRAVQAELARGCGIGAFCYYHYWFQGRRLLERPVNEIIASGAPDFPFCLCWANENWTRTWDGGEHQILLEQTYSDEDDERHFKALLPAFSDPRYLRRAGCPVFVVYRAARLPQARRFTERWQKLARAHGLPGLHLLRVEGAGETGDPGLLGFDGAIDFRPQATELLRQAPRWAGGRRRLAEKIGGPAAWRQHVFDYGEFAAQVLAAPPVPYVRHPCVVPRWDNSARRARRAVILRGSTPRLYETWLRETIARSGTEYVFINAWNEWAEGCHLEPCLRHGHAYLDATRRALGVERPEPSAAARG